MKYKLVIPKSVHKQIEKLNPTVRNKIINAILALENGPFPKGKKIKHLKGLEDEFVRLRVGDYRVLYEVVGENISILGVVHRKDLDRWVKKR